MTTEIVLYYLFYTTYYSILLVLYYINREILAMYVGTYKISLNIGHPPRLDDDLEYQ